MKRYVWVWRNTISPALLSWLPSSHLAGSAPGFSALSTLNFDLETDGWLGPCNDLRLLACAVADGHIQAAINRLRQEYAAAKEGVTP